jgi:hypothetical protein
MTKLVFFHYFKFTKEFIERNNELMPDEWKKYNDLLKKHSLKLLTHGRPFGTDYNWVGVIESEKGMEAWTSFIDEYLPYGETLGYARADTKTVVIRAPE